VAPAGAGRKKAGRVAVTSSKTDVFPGEQLTVSHVLEALDVVEDYLRAVRRALSGLPGETPLPARPGSTLPATNIGRACGKQED
jgi:hypothetical protein